MFDCQVIPENHQNVFHQSDYNGLNTLKNISTTIHAMTKSFVPFCSAQDGESTDMNCLVFWAHCKNGKILMKYQVYNKGIFANFGCFLQYKMLISLECTVDSEWNGIINSVVSCLIVKLFLHENHQRVFHFNDLAKCELHSACSVDELRVTTNEMLVARFYLFLLVSRRNCVV